MSRLRKTQEVTCKTCCLAFQKRCDGLKTWTGNCKSCASKHGAKRTYIEKICLDCPKNLSRSCKSGRCKKCQTHERFNKIENHPRWIKDRTKLAKKQERNDMAYKEWRRQVWLRDNFKCKIANPDCLGRLEAHHILSWSEYLELHYEVNNGITLCHAHHPRARAEEKRLSPYFMELVTLNEK